MFYRFGEYGIRLWSNPILVISNTPIAWSQISIHPPNKHGFWEVFYLREMEHNEDIVRIKWVIYGS